MDTQTLLSLWTGQRCADSPVKLMGFRGGLASGQSSVASLQNSVGSAYDDLIVRIIDGVATFWRASVDPSAPLIANPINPSGAAMLCDGVHLFEKHLMHGKYWCLGQAEDVHVYRFNPATGKPRLTALGQAVTEFGQFGICIHSGGSGADTGRFSAGCQILFNRDGYFCNPTWSSFYGPIVAAMDAHQLTTIPYMLRDQVGLGTGLKLENC